MRLTECLFDPSTAAAVITAENGQVKVQQAFSVHTATPESIEAWRALKEVEFAKFTALRQQVMQVVVPFPKGVE